MMNQVCSRSMMRSWMPMLEWARIMNDLYWAGVMSSCRKTRKNRQSCEKGRDGSTPGASNIVETAVAGGFLTTLVEALEKAGLVDILQGVGPFTVFAPSDEAFSKIPSERLQSILEDEEKLRQVLTYHVVPGRYPASSLSGIASLRSMEGSVLKVDTRVGTKVGTAHVIRPDLPASNGVIHVIDSVLIPETK